MGPGNAIDSRDLMSAVRLCAFLAIVASASVTGTNTTSRIVTVTTATARPRLPPTSACSRKRDGHVATLTIVAHRTAVTKGMRTEGGQRHEGDEEEHRQRRVRDVWRSLKAAGYLHFLPHPPVWYTPFRRYYANSAQRAFLQLFPTRAQPEERRGLSLVRLLAGRQPRVDGVGVFRDRRLRGATFTRR